MNIQFQLCGLCILTLLILFYKSHRTLRLYRERIFYVALCVITASLVGDVLSLYAIHYRQVLPVFSVHFVCKTYIISLIWGSWSALVYIITDLMEEKKHKTITAYLAGTTLLQSLLVYCLPISIYDDGVSVYTYGPAVSLVYLLVGVKLLSTIVLTLWFRKRIHPRRISATLLWMLIWILSAVVQFFNNSLLIVGFASALGMLILFVVIENPEANQERKLGCFNSYALSEYLLELYDHDRPFSVLQIFFDNTDLLDVTQFHSAAARHTILRSMGKDILVFKNTDLSLVLVSERTETLLRARKLIRELLDRTTPDPGSVTMILTSETGAFSSPSELFHFLSEVKSKSAGLSSRLIVADHSTVKAYQQKFQLEQEIRDALAEDRVEVFLQPIYDVTARRFTSAEALMRIRKTDGSLLSPGIFIPIAEQNGQILQLGERIFEKVCGLLNSTDAVRLGLHYVEINLSVVQCEQADLGRRLMEIAGSSRVNPGQINLEITETASISARKVLLENMKLLMEYGFSFSLDDFGKGESNLMYMVEMPVSLVKIDYDMSKAFFHSGKAQHVVRAVVSLAHDMGMKVVVEGIETAEEARLIQQEGIDYIQGYYYANPLPEAEFLAFLREQNSAPVSG